MSSKTSFDNPCLRRYNCVFWLFTYCTCERRHLFFAFHLLSLCELWQSYDILPRSSRKKYPLMLSHTSSADLVRLHTRACFSLSIGFRTHLALRTSCCHPCRQEGLLLHGWSWICLCTNERHAIHHDQPRMAAHRRGSSSGVVEVTRDNLLTMTAPKPHRKRRDMPCPAAACLGYVDVLIFSPAFPTTERT